MGKANSETPEKNWKDIKRHGSSRKDMKRSENSWKDLRGHKNIWVGLKLRRPGN